MEPIPMMKRLTVKVKRLQRQGAQEEGYAFYLKKYYFKPVSLEKSILFQARRARGGKTVPGAARGRGGANTAATRKATRAQLAPPAPPPESKPPANLTKLGQSPAKTMLRTAKNTPVKKEEKPVAERKTYPQRTNRKPPAHLADAFGPGFNSSPDLSKKEVAKKELVAEIKEEDDSGYALDIIPNNTAQALLVPEVIQELQAVLGDLGPEVLKPLEEAKVFLTFIYLLGLLAK